MNATPSWPPAPSARWRSALAAALSLVLLNGLLSFRNWWPTPGIVPDWRLSPEAVGLWLVLLGWAAWRGGFSRRALAGFTMVFALLVLGRYANVTVPTLFGRPVNLYWDGQQIPRFLWVTARDQPGWATAMAVVAVLMLLALLGWLLYGVMVRVATRVVPAALRWRASWVPTGLAAGTVALHLAGTVPSFTWHVVADPITPTYARQAVLLATAFLPGGVEATVPRATALERALTLPPAQALGALRGRDLNLIFLESYGMVAYEHPAIAPALEPARQRFGEDLARGGHLVASAVVRAATFAGASELSHLSLLSGVDLSNPLRHDLLLTTDRPTLPRLFRQAGYEAVGLYPALSWDWAEAAFYGFDRFLDARDLDYRGPPLGYWKVPDAFSLARYEQIHPRDATARPRLLFFPTITSHLPFGPVPPHQPDWDRLLSPDPFGAEATERLRNAYVDWLDMRPNYIGMFDYTYRWLGAWLARPAPREQVWLLVGDHQPAASVSGEGASWDVPVHVVTQDPALLARFVAQGFTPGLVPRREPLGGMHDLTAMLLKALEAAPAASAP